MSEQGLTYEEYNDRSLAVRGDRKKYSDKLKDIGGRWNPRMKDGEGWLVPKENIDELKNIISSINNSNTTENVHQIKSRKNQNKYHREISDIDDSDSKN